MGRRVFAKGLAIRGRIVATIDALRIRDSTWPTQEQVRTALGIPRSTARHHLRILESEGRVERLVGGRVLRTRPALPENSEASPGHPGTARADPMPEGEEEIHA